MSHFLSHGGSVKFISFASASFQQQTSQRRGRIDAAENRPSVCIETHILRKQTVIQRGLAYILWGHEIQTDDVDDYLDT